MNSPDYNNYYGYSSSKQKGRYVNEG
jgi:hypothetical protein